MSVQNNETTLNEGGATPEVPNVVMGTEKDFAEEAAKVAAMASGESHTADGKPRPNATPVTKAKYVPTTTDLEVITRNLKQSLIEMNREATKLESRGVPYLLALCDYAVNHRVERMEWPDKEKLRKFLRDKGAEPDKTASTYTKTIVNQAVSIVRLVTDATFPVYLGYRWSEGKSSRFTVEKPTDNAEFTRVLIAPDKAVNPKIRAGKEFIDNTNETLVPITFNGANKLLNKLTKGVRQPRPEGNDKTEGATASAAIDVVKAYGMPVLLETMGEMLASKETVPTKELICTPFELAGKSLAKVNAAWPDKIPENMLRAIIQLKMELDERIELIVDGADAGKYRIVAVDGLSSVTVNPETLPE